MDLKLEGRDELTVKGSRVGRGNRSAGAENESFGVVAKNAQPNLNYPHLGSQSMLDHQDEEKDRR